MKTYHDYNFFDYETSDYLGSYTTADAEVQKTCELLKQLFWSLEERRIAVIKAVQTYTGDTYIF